MIILALKTYYFALMVKLNTNIILKLHVGFWVLVVTIIGVSFLSGTFDDKPMNIFWGYFIRIFFRFFFFYLFYFAVPKIPVKLPRAVFFGLAGLMFIALSTALLDYLFLNSLSVLYNRTYNSVDYRFMYFELLASHFVYSATGILFRTSISWYERIRSRSELERQSISNKLALLAAQINPHFLFNTLNNINSFIQTDPPKASFAVAKLKQIMQYMLNISGTEKTQLEKDIEIIRDYIELQKVRYVKPDYIMFNVSRNCSGISVPPLLFMPFVENAFKHGKKQDQSPGIVFSIDVKNDSICFDSFNYVSQKNELHEKGGFGLNNIRSRMDLLFHSNYTLTINENNESFKVKLEFNYR